MDSEYYAPNLTGGDIHKNSHDIPQAHVLLHGEERTAYGDAGYQGVEKCEENRDTPAIWRVAMRPGIRRQMDAHTRPGRLQERLEHRNASVRAKQGGAPVSHREEPAGVSDGLLSWAG